MARNTDVARNIGKLSRSQLFSKKASYKRDRNTAPKAEAPAAEDKAPAFYPADDVRKPKISRKSNKTAALRASITPGTVLILLAGRFRGKRVVALKQLESGLVLVTGPYKVNGVPLRRVNQAYVIATSTKVDISSLQLDAKFNDAYFTKEKKGSRKGSEGEFFKDGEEKKAFPAERAADQKAVDKAVLAAVAATPNLAKYLHASFGLTNGQYPHLLKFWCVFRLLRPLFPSFFFPSVSLLSRREQYADLAPPSLRRSIVPLPPSSPRLYSLLPPLTPSLFDEPTERVVLFCCSARDKRAHGDDSGGIGTG